MGAGIREQEGIELAILSDISKKQIHIRASA